MSRRLRGDEGSLALELTLIAPLLLVLLALVYAYGRVGGTTASFDAGVRDAARAATRLHELGRELRFDHGDDGRLKVELHDSVSGESIRSVPTAEVFDFAEGKVTN